MRRPDSGGTLRDALRRAVLVAAVVGTLLLAINQGDLILALEWSAALWWKIPLTYAVPFCVSLYSSLAASRPD
ncbi:MAG: nitrate/nitrite transporter NrtS [Gemmatimonadales bacterium]